jgi:uncharacterized protein (TIGR03435 family)
MAYNGGAMNPISTMLLGILLFQNFEAVTLKPLEGGGRGRISCQGVDSKVDAASPFAPPGLGRCIYVPLSVESMVYHAYRTNMTNVSLAEYVFGMPSWTREEFFELQGKAEDPSKATEGDLRRMVQNHLQDVLREQYKLEFHRESRDLKAYALTLGRNGHKLAASAGEPTGMLERGETITAKAATMPLLAASLRNALRVPVIDRTELEGAYDVTLTWNFSDPGSLFPAIQDQLGLRLEPTTISVEVIVVDRIQKRQ